MKYIRVGWPEIQDYMDRIDYQEKVGFDPIKNAWFIPEDWEGGFKELKEVKENVFESLMEGFKESENVYNECLEICN
jgi:hypothetical protein